MIACPMCCYDNLKPVYSYNSEHGLRMGLKAEPFAYFCPNCGNTCRAADCVCVEPNVGVVGIVDDDMGEPGEPESKVD